MHTPDSRIRADYGLPPGVPTREQAGHLVDQMTPELRAEMEAYWDRAEASTTATPDTSTTAGRIAVMQAWDRGEDIEVAVRNPGCPWRKAYGGFNNIPSGDWDWNAYDYRIAPPPAPRTALQRARACRSGMTTVNSESPDGILCCLLTDIDYSPVVEVLERRISWDAADLSALPKGRYRLLRDDA